MNSTQQPTTGYNQREPKFRVTNNEELQARLASIPEYSARVYATLQSSLYAEPFFSDVTVKDLAEKMGESTQAIRGALALLTTEGLVYSEEYSANYRTRIFLHTFEHDKFQFI